MSSTCFVSRVWMRYESCNRFPLGTRASRNVSPSTGCRRSLLEASIEVCEPEWRLEFEATPGSCCKSPWSDGSGSGSGWRCLTGYAIGKHSTSRSLLARQSSNIRRKFLHSSRPEYDASSQHPTTTNTSLVPHPEISADNNADPREQVCVRGRACGKEASVPEEGEGQGGGSVITDFKRRASRRPEATWACARRFRGCRTRS